MMSKLNNHGFTLIELLAVLVILIGIMSVSVPTITTSLEKNKDSQNENLKKIIERSAELYVTDHKKEMTSSIISLDVLVSEGYLSENSIHDADGDKFTGCVKYTSSNNTYQYQDNC